MPSCQPTTPSACLACTDPYARDCERVDSASLEGAVREDEGHGQGVGHPARDGGGKGALNAKNEGER